MKSKILNSNGKFLLLCLVGMLMTVQGFAQTITVNGIVKDKTGEAVIGANVLVKGTTNGTITDFDGIFTLNANKGDIIVFSFIGYTILFHKVTVRHVFRYTFHIIYSLITYAHRRSPLIAISQY